MSILTCIAPVNIAVIKYWGKRDEKLILPLNDSLSVTLGTDEMHAKTTVMTSSDFTSDRMWLNGKEESISNPRLTTCLSEIRKRVRVREEAKGGGGSQGENRADCKIHICSENNFPTAAGLASSAAGYACLVYSLSRLFGLEGDVSNIARLGSGSACRSLSGGFVRWRAGSEMSGGDSVSEQVAPASHWPTIRVLILVVNDGKKKTSSTDGMERSVKTSELLKHRVKHCVPHRTDTIIKAIEKKDFSTFAEVTMKDSNQLHSVCLDTFPPAVYMNDVSHSIVEFVHSYNKAKRSTRLCYTFDAGPNACLLMEEKDVDQVVTLVKETFPPPLDLADNNYVRGLKYNVLPLQQELGFSFGPLEAGLLKYLILTKVGTGPEMLEGSSQHLLDTETGLPKSLNINLST